MQSKWMRRLGTAALFGMVAYASIGCAQERDPRNYVQPNAMDKSFFVGANLRDASDDPEFYMRNTLVDVPYGSGVDGLFTATYAQPLSRMKWEIQENSLYARLTYERIENSDHKGSKRTNDGAVVAMFHIESHFDVKRAYNPTTGEDLNVIEENTTDRPWYERQYMRVDWSQNLITDAYQLDTLSQIGAFGVSYAPLAYKIEDPTDPNAPLFKPEEGYFDITQKAFATPEIYHTQWGDYPACFFTGQITTDCNPTELTLRLSFKKVEDTDYEPVEWDGKKMDAFGAFTEERFGYDRNFGLIDQNWHRFAGRHNIWQKSHIEGSQCGVDFWRDDLGNIVKYKQNGDGTFPRDANGLPIPDPNGAPFVGTPAGLDPKRDVDTDGDHGGTEDDCQFFANGGDQLLHKGAYCDLAVKKCALPLYERKIKTIPWYYGPGENNDLFPSTNDALNGWNLAVKEAALLGMKAEAERVGVTFDGNLMTSSFGSPPEAIDAIIAGFDDDDTYKNDKTQADAAHKLPVIPDVFVMCHNPTIETDAPGCFKTNADGSTEGVYARIGDLRYNTVNMVANPQTGSPWGIMVDAVDPLSGEKVSGSVNEWIQVLDYATQANMDLIRWINGEISDQQITSGAYLRDWVNASKLGQSAYSPKTLSRDEITARANSVDATLRNMNGLTAADANLPHEIRNQKVSEHLASALGPSLTPDLEAARQKMIGSKWEAAMVTPQMLQNAGFAPNTPIADDSTLSAASPIRGRNPALRRWFESQRAVGLAQRHACMVEQPEPDGLVGLARMAQRDYPLPDANQGGPCAYDNTLDQSADYPACVAMRDKRLHQWIRERFHLAVVGHEMGHSMALRHNFTGSADSFNYHQEYWQLRTRNGVEKKCLDAVTPHTDGHDCVGPRWIDPVTDEEVNGIIWRYAGSTLMDYPGDPTQDMIGVGAYDKAAMRFIYGNVADVEEDATVGSARGKAFIGALDGTIYNAAGVGDMHYSKLNDSWKMIDPAKRPCTLLPGATDGSTNPLDYKCDRYGHEGPDVALGSGHRLLHPSLRDMQTTPKYDFGDAAANALILKLRPDLVSNFAVWQPAGSTKKFVRHPYTFSSDEYADSANIPIFRFDAGADAYEMMQFLISTYENRYIFDNFRRDRTTFSPYAAGERVMSRYWDKIQGMAKSFFLSNFYAQTADLSNADALLPHVLATSDSFEMFIRALTRPEPGSYVIDNSGATPVARVLTPAELATNPNGDFKIAVGSGEGRYINNDYDYSKGELWYEYPLVAGTWFEKQVALYYLLEAENHYVSNQKEDYIDGRYKNTNYATIYPEQVRRLLAELVQGDKTTLGPYISTSTGTLANTKVGRVQYLPWHLWNASSSALAYPSDAVVLDPLYGWNQQQYGILYMFWYGNTKLTMDLADQSRIYSSGDGATVSIEPAEQVRYTDPFSGLTYVARNYGKEIVNSKNEAVMRTTGARMLQYANQLAEQAFQVTAKDPVTGELTYVKDSSGNAVCKLAAADCSPISATLRNYSSNIDTARQVSLWWGYGPLQ